MQGVLKTMELTLSLDTGYSMGINKIFLIVPWYVTSLRIVLNSSQVGSVSILSESIQLPSELITVTYCDDGR